MFATSKKISNFAIVLGVVQPVPESAAEQELPYQHFRFRVLALYRGHTTVALFFGHFVHIDT